MNEGRLGLMSRLWMFLWLPFKALFDAGFAWRVEQVLKPGSLEKPRALEPAAAPLPTEPAAPAPQAKAPQAVAPPAPRGPDNDQALYLLAVLQRDGRLIDFLQEDIAGATDDQVGGAARIVHEGCRKALSQYIRLQPIRSEGEGSPIVVSQGFDPSEIRLTGNVTGAPPFRGQLAHAGWRAVEVKLPAVPEAQDPSVIMPAEVEI